MILFYELIVARAVILLSNQATSDHARTLLTFTRDGK